MKRILSLLAVPALLVGLLSPASAGPTPGGFASDNVEFVGHVPFESATSTGVTLDGKYMYLTSWKNVSVYDISDPTSPQLLDIEHFGFWFENEDVPVSPDGNTMLFSESLPGDALHVWDVEDKTNIKLIASLEGAGDHTASCILKCKWVYGSDGTIVDLRDPTKPKLAAARGDKNNWHAQVGIKGGGHDVTEYRNGFILVSTISEGFQIVDVRKPTAPKLVSRSAHPNPAWLFHSGEWPRGGRDKLVLLQGEKNFKPQCNPDSNGPFQTWTPSGNSFKLLDTYAVENGTYQDGQPAVNALGCSAHWFEAHRKFKNGGLVTAGFYEHGTRFLDIAPNGKINEAGYFVPYGGSTSAAYWVPTDKEGRLAYAVDYTRGIDIIRFTGKI